MTADRRRVWLLLFASLLLWACGGPRSRLLAEADAEGEVADALALIVELPDWDRTRTRDEDQWFTADDVRTYVETARVLRAMDPDNVRAAYRIYVDWAAEQPDEIDVHPTHVLFVLDRVLFALPGSAPREEARFFAVVGSTAAAALGPPNVPLLQPIVVDDAGAIADIAPSWAIRSPRGPYDAVAAFDHYRATYGFRDPIRYAGDPPPP